MAGTAGHVGLWLHGPVEGLWTGWPVYFYTLSKISIAGIPLLLISFFKTKKYLYLAYALLFAFPMIMSIFGSGRRGNSFVLISMILVVLVSKTKFQIPRVAIPIGLVLAAIIAFGLPIWRVSFEEIGFIKSIKQTSLKEIIEKQKDQGGPEYIDSLILMEIVRKDNHYQYGLGIFDQLINSYLPGSIIGNELKDDVMIFRKYRESIFMKGYEYGRVIPSYTAKSGIVDAFSEFSYLGVFTFMALGYFWGRITRPLYIGSDLSFHFLCLFALNGAHFIYSGVFMRLALDLPSFMCVYCAYYYCKIPKKRSSKKTKEIRHGWVKSTVEINA